MRIIENFKIGIYRLIAGGMFRQLAFLFIFFVLVFISLSYMLDMESSRLFHNMTSFDYPPKDNKLLLHKDDKIDEEDDAFEINSEEDLRNKLLAYEEMKRITGEFSILEDKLLL